MDRIIERAKEVFDIEIAGLQALRDHLNGEFFELVNRCTATLDKGGPRIKYGVRPADLRG